MRGGAEKTAGLRIRHISMQLFLCVFLLFLCIPAASAAGIRSRAAVVVEAGTVRVLYAKNPDETLLPASTTKLMTALVVLDSNPDLGRVVTISKTAAHTARTRVGFKAGEKVTVGTLLYSMLMKSANDAAVALAEEVAGSEEQFAVLMNRKAAELGATNTRYINANGLPGPGQQITARDLSNIMREAIRHPVVREILATREARVTTESGKTKYIRNTNKLLWADEDILGGKTGYTRDAMHCFVCAGARGGETLIVAVLGAPSRRVMWMESEGLLALGSEIISNEAGPSVYPAESDNDTITATKASSGRTFHAHTSLLRQPSVLRHLHGL